MHVFDSAGTYTIALTGFYALNGCPATAYSTLEVVPNPVADFIPDDTDGCVPFDVCFTNTSVGATYYEWDFGDEQTDSTEEPCHTYTEPGTYTVTLKSTDLNGCFTDTAVFNIIVHELPVSGFQPTEEVYCGFLDPISFDNQSQGAADYEWTFGNGDYLHRNRSVDYVFGYWNLSGIPYCYQSIWMPGYRL